MRFAKLLRAILVAGLALVFMVPGYAQTGRKLNDTDQFIALMERYYAAWNTLNLDNADPFYAKDASLIFYDIAPLEYKGWEQYKRSVGELFSQYSSFRLIPNKDLRVARRGDVAWVTLTLHLSAVHKTAGPLEIDARHTAILERRGRRWLIVHEHISTPLPG